MMSSSQTFPKYLEAGLGVCYGRACVIVRNSPIQPVALALLSPIQDLHKQMNLLQSNKLVVILSDARDEEQTRVALVHDLLVLPLDESAHLGRAAEDEVGYVAGRGVSDWGTNHSTHITHTQII